MDDQQSELKALGKQYAGPVLTAYVRWILSRASERGIKRIYFLARDGYTLKKIAEYICRRLGVSMDCRYLYCSRFSLRLPTYHFIGDEAMDMLLIPAVKNTVHGVFRRACLSETEEKQVLASLPFECADPCKPMDREEYAGFCGAIRKSGVFADIVRSRSAAAYNSAVKYFEQEGLLSDADYAIADSGWTGSMQRSLRQVLEHSGYKRKLTGFYFGLFGEPKSGQDGSYEAMYFSGNTHLKDKILFSNNLFECWLSAPHAMTTGYKEENGEYIPIFAESPSERECALVNAHIDGIMEYVAGCADEELDFRNIDEKELHLATERILHRIMVHPTQTEAAAYGGFMFSDDVSSEGMKKLASAEQLSSVKSYSLVKRALGKITASKGGGADLFWVYGTLAFAPEPKRRWYLANIYAWEWLRLKLKK